MTKKTVVLHINHQQRPVVDQLLASGRHGATAAEVVRSGFLAYCRLSGVAPSTIAGTGEGASS